MEVILGIAYLISIGASFLFLLYISLFMMKIVKDILILMLDAYIRRKK